MTDRPTLRLRPKTSPQRFRFGAPWVYADELVLDRRTRAIPSGSIATIEDDERRPFATVAVNASSKIVGRILDLDPDAVIDASWLRPRVEAAIALRQSLYDEPYYRLIHAEADGLPGVVVDRFGDTLVLQPNAAWADVLKVPLAETLAKVAGAKAVYLNAAGRARKLEGLDDESAPLIGDAPQTLPVHMNGATYMADLTQGQKTGIFFDQRENHAFAARLSAGADVLDVFSHVGGFGLAALANGAASVLAVDASAPALALAEEGAQRMDAGDKLTTQRGDAVDILRELADQGRNFDHVICDPPAFAPNKQSLEAGLRGYERVANAAAKLVRPGGYLTLCSCSHAAELARFREVSLRGIGRAGQRAQLIHTGFAGPDHPVHAHLAESSYLKALFFRLLP